jgi:hypothetical protein
MKALYKKKAFINNRTMGNFNSYGLINGNFSRLKLDNNGGWRVYRRFFCNQRENVVLLDSNKTGNGLDNISPEVNELTKQSIVYKDFNKGIIIYDSTKSIIDKIFTFKIHKCGKFIDLTKNFLTDPKFLKFAYYQIRNAKGAHVELDGINDL